MNSIERKEWRELWLDSINELSTFELQEKSWLRKIVITESPHWSYAEFMSCYFDDLLYHDYAYFINKGWISKAEFEIIVKWHEELDSYVPPKRNNYNHRAILNDTNWLRIVKLGEKAKNDLVKIIPENEKKFLMGIKAYPPHKKISLFSQILNKLSR